MIKGEASKPYFTLYKIKIMIHRIIKADRIKGTYKLNLEFRNWEKKVFNAESYVWWKSFTLKGHLVFFDH